MSHSKSDEAKRSKLTNEMKDEPGAEGRFLSGVRKALEMPHKPHKLKAPPKKKGTKR